METTQSWINGESVPSADTYDNVDPATGRTIGLVARAGADEVDRAVAAAAAAQPAWADTSPEERSELLERWAATVEREAEQLARWECEDTGKPLSQARADARTAARYLRYYAHVVEAFYGITIPKGADLHAYTRREPFGVVGSVVAWNYPLQLASRTLAAAAVTGNGIVLKPADETPRTTVALARYAVEAGLPAGLVNVVTGIGAEAGAALTAHEGVSQLSFVGSTTIGSQIAHAAAERVVPTVLELGGKSAQVVFADADLEAAAEAVARGVLQNAGQTCSAGSRLLVHADVHDELVSKVVQRLEGTTIGPGLDDPDLGPLVSAKQWERVSSFFTDLGQGEVLTGGGRPADEALAEGAYFAPTVVDGVDPHSRIAQEEVFGPVLAAMTFTDEDEAVALANSTEYGLLAALWTRDLSRAHRLAGRVRAGQVFVNNYGAGGGVDLPFGGFGKSGYGREKGLEALESFTQTKTVVIKL
ncbi:aldehyde dehydrogenase family protein [Ornithinicoccus hortensis]|uniref:Aldehyde dehydrogenase (NAD+)/betaine-aldehyde dehydrogenase n=1 Tax=Ornithinicoccus hortensis TaxID=82346 RepID=A0A542YV86_9MICO|nr:aldehyde dehydrogenase family protein [Ornithinicoccus hortensis]TQL51997.1 aldehyde dehydrogenase (NAD+)/betaine-aldehyde dehydrogenase [Ornithinicoccus hortensis]